jgi:hypothetical protein
MDLLLLIADVGLPESLPAKIECAALDRELAAAITSQRSRRRLLTRLARRGGLIPVILLFTTAAALAATGVATGLFNFSQAAKQNVLDTPLKLFQADLPAKAGATPASLWRQTVIASTVRVIATPTIVGVGKVQYWVADTRENGICTALRLPDGSWAGLRNLRQLGGALVGCRPTRAQLSHGTLILSGFDYTDAEVLDSKGQELVLDYGEINVPGHPTKIRDQYSHATAPVIDGKYFLVVTHPVRTKHSGIDIDDYTTLVALNRSGKIIANEHEPLPGAAGDDAPK